LQKLENLVRYGLTSAEKKMETFEIPLTTTTYKHSTDDNKRIIWKEGITAKFKVLNQDFRRTGENHDIPVRIADLRARYSNPGFPDYEV
jgi:hypothetical protein